jgi:hypothetical protein
MKATNKETATTERRKTDRRTASERRIDVARAVEGDRRVVENRGECDAMVDALEDILRWEKTSERSLKVAAKVVTGDQPSN